MLHLILVNYKLFINSWTPFGKPWYRLNLCEWVWHHKFDYFMHFSKAGMLYRPISFWYQICFMNKNITAYCRSTAVLRSYQCWWEAPLLNVPQPGRQHEEVCGALGPWHEKVEKITLTDFYFLSTLAFSLKAHTAHMYSHPDNLSTVYYITYADETHNSRSH